MTDFFQNELSIGDLLLIAISIPPRDVEHTLDSLAKLPRHINPTLKYSEWLTTIEFPAYREWLPDIHAVLAQNGHETATVQIFPPVGFESSKPEDMPKALALPSGSK